MHKPLFNERKARINQVEIILKLTEKYTKLNRVKPKTERLSLETETLTEFNRVKSRITNSNS